MSWDRTEHTEVATCACGNGKIVRQVCTACDDWNRVESAIISEKINCQDCIKKFHIEHYVRHINCPSWEGDGIIDKAFLVPNNLTIPQELSERCFHFEIDEEIVSKYSLEDIIESKADMIRNKFSTRLERKSSREIIALYFRKYRRKSLPPIIRLLNYIENQYEKYVWTPQRLQEFRSEEKYRLRENKHLINEILSKSFELDFKRI